MSIITIVGSGMMGSAIGIPAADNGHEVRLVGTPLDREIIEHARQTGEHLTLKRKLPASYRYYQFEEMEDALRGADLMVGGVSSFGIDWFCENVLKIVDPELPILTVTKGMQDDEEGNLHVYPEIFEQKSGCRGLKLNAVGGPCTSYELADHDDTEVTFCGKDLELLAWIRSLFETDYYHVSISDDVIGVEASVAMKNAYALAVTLAVGLAERRDGQEGAHIIATGRREDRLAALREEILAEGGRCDVLAGDIADLALGEQLRSLALEKTGRIDILLYSAGMALRSPTLDMTPEEWNRVMQVNVTAAMFLAQKCIPQMAAQKYGKIIFISSTAAKNTNQGASPSYDASKAAMNAVIRHIAAEFAKDHVYANAICPGPPMAVYLFWNMKSPLNILPIILPKPPVPWVCICILGVIQLMAPRSVMSDSPASTLQITTGSGSPTI